MGKVIGLRAGHSPKALGSIGILNEHIEMKRFYQAVKAVLEKYGHKVVDCNSDADTEAGELVEGITKANNANVDLFISLHMNAFDGTAHGTEMWVKNQSSSAYSIAQKLVDNFVELGFVNRGVKFSSEFYEMNHSNAPNIISEICFCDSQTDVDIIYKYSWQELAYIFANAIDSSIPVKSDGDTSSESGNNETIDESLNMYNLVTKDENGNIINQAKTSNNTISATTDLINKYGIRQEIIFKNSNEDPVITAKRKLNDSCTPKEEIEVECIGDTMYRVGYGVHVILPFLPTYNDCFMYIKEVTNEWKNNGTFISTLTLSPSRVMDEQEWTDDTTEDDDLSLASSGSELASKIIALLKQQVGVSYAWGGKSPESGFDCSGLIYYCYNQFKDELGITLGVSTYEQVKQGTEVDKNDKDSWIEGDLLFWIGQSTPPSHVSVYLGNNQMIHAPSSGKTVEIIDISRTDIYAVRRVIPESVSLELDTGEVSIPDDYVSQLNYVNSNCTTFISNMKKYGFKDYIISVSKEKSVDPYITASIIAIESEGNPNCGSTYYGLMQVAGGSSDPKTNIGQGLDVYNNKKFVVGSQTHVILSAYNSGEGTVLSASKAKELNLSNCGIKELGDALYDYVKSHNPSWDANEKKYYSSKVLKAYSILKSNNALN